MTKREKGAERRAKLEEVQRAQKAQARKRNVLTASIGIVAGVVIIGGTIAVIASQEGSKPKNQSLDSFGVSAAAAGCGEVESNKVGAAGDHVGPGTDKASVTKVAYDTVPPTSGQHFVSPLPSSRNFYTVADSPRVESLVHNLEHGYSVLWYSTDLPAADIDTIEGLSEKLASTTPNRKFIAAPWDGTYGELPSGKTVAISHWGKTTGYRMSCEKISGPAIQQFVDDHPSSDSPEPDAA